MYRCTGTGDFVTILLSFYVVVEVDVFAREVL